MLSRLLEPLLWRGLKAPHPTVRFQCAQALFEARDGGGGSKDAKGYHEPLANSESISNLFEFFHRRTTQTGLVE